MLRFGTVKLPGGGQGFIRQAHFPSNYLLEIVIGIIEKIAGLVAKTC
jgi:hypothetical protein